jgi:cytochrome c peroxidase
MQSKVSILFVVYLVVIQGCVTESTENYRLDHLLEEIIGNKEDFILPSSTEFSKIPQSPVNPLTREKVDLGKMLFFETAFGVEAKKPELTGTFSCSTCHVVEKGFRPGLKQGIADGAVGFGRLGDGRVKLEAYKDEEIDAQGARPLATINTAFVHNTMWNGSFGDGFANKGTEHVWGKSDPGTARNAERLGALEGQNIEGLIVHRLLYNKELIEKFGYKLSFDKAFSNWPESERYSRKAASFAISAYLRSVTTDQAPFQLWLKGNKQAMTEQQKRGALLFFGKAGCDGCHNEKNLGSTTFHALGVKDLFEAGGRKTSINDLRNLGRGGFTGLKEDLYKFRTPQLYNMGDTGPYFHGASKLTLEEVIEYKIKGVPENPRVPKEQLSSYMYDKGLTTQEKADLVEFVKEGLRDPNLLRYKPARVMSNNCIPNNDIQSRKDVGCN